MPQYTYDDKGNAIGVFLPISYWNKLRTKYSDLEELENELQPWQKDLIDERLDAIQANPERLRPLDELIEELDKD